jgi:hypothetical protein
MIKQIKYKIAVSRAVAAATAKENENIPKIKEEEKAYYEFRREPRSSGEIAGRERRKTRTIDALNAEIKKAQRDIAHVHTDYLRAEMKKLGIPLPDKNERELWLRDREDYLFLDGSRETAYPPASGATECCDGRGRFVLEQITNITTCGGPDDRFPLLMLSIRSGEAPRQPCRRMCACLFSTPDRRSSSQIIEPPDADG